MIKLCETQAGCQQEEIKWLMELWSTGNRIGQYSNIPVFHKLQLLDQTLTMTTPLGSR